MKEEITETPNTESLDDLQAQIAKLQEKARKKAETEILKENDEATVLMPLADITLRLDKNGSDMDLKNITPAELLFLCAEHHANAGGNPISKCVPIGKSVRRDPRIERKRLMAKYSAKKINLLFPGTEPKLPETFSRAITIGTEVDLPGENLLSFTVQPLGTLGD